MVMKKIINNGQWVLFIVASMMFLRAAAALGAVQDIQHYISFILTLGCWVSSVVLLIALKREQNKRNPVD